MKITWGEIKKNLRIVHHESVEAYENQNSLTSDYEFEFNLDVDDIGYYLLSKGTIKAVTRPYSMKEMFEMGISNWDGEKIIEINWKEKDNSGPQNKMHLMTMEEYAAIMSDGMVKNENIS